MRVNDLVEILSDVAQQTVSRYVNGEGRNPKIQAAIAAALGVELDEILLKPETSHAPTEQAGQVVAA